MNEHSGEPLDIRIDLIGDLREIVRSTLIDAGYSQGAVDRAANDDYRLISYYFGIVRRSISSHPRTVHRSKGFSCPPEHSRALAKIEQMITEGVDISAYTSTDTKRLKTDDVMLNAWGVHHLHLGHKVNKKGRNTGFIQRTHSLLFCYFTDTEAYFIGVFDHDSFASQAVIEIVHENWPELISRFRIPGVTQYPPLSDEQVFELRRVGYSVFTTVQDGTTYMPVEGGVMLSGDSVNDVMKTNRLLTWLHHMQTSIVQFIERDKHSGVLSYPSPIDLRLRYVANEPCVEDVQNGDIYRVDEHGVTRIRGGVM